MVVDGSEKISFSLALSELVLDDAKVKIFLISRHFPFFWLRPPTRPFIDTLMFWYIKGVQATHIWAKFHLYLVFSSRVLKFQMFSYQQNVQF